MLFTLILSVSKGHTQANNQEGKDWRKVDAADKTNLNETLNKDEKQEFLHSLMRCDKHSLKDLNGDHYMLHAGPALLHQRK